MYSVRNLLYTNVTSVFPVNKSLFFEWKQQTLEYVLNWRGNGQVSYVLL